jgi:mannose-1-phosphate guanylyltransferase/phosphomannomutase
VEQYAEGFYHHLKTEEIDKRKLKVIADFAFGRLGNVYPQMLGRLGIDLIALNAYADLSKAPKTPEAREALLPNLKQIVQTLGADIGVLFEADGERMTLVDETGAVIDGDLLLTMVSVLQARTRPGARIAVPVTAPRAVEPLVALHGGSVVRTKTDARHLMGACAGDSANRAHFAADDAGGFIFSDFQPSFDSMFGFAKLLEMLTVTDMRLSELAAELPETHLARAVVRCPWEVKGKVMRVLTKEDGENIAHEAGGRVELVDGIKFYHQDDWALVLPDASEPFFHVYAESGSAEDANKLLCRYVERIEQLRA